MAEKTKKKDRKRSESTSDASSKVRKDKKERKQTKDKSASILLADSQAVDPTLSSLFAVKQPPVKAKISEKPASIAASTSHQPESDDLSELDDDDDDDETLDVVATEQLGPRDVLALDEAELAAPESEPKRKRKRKDADEQLEDAYMHKLAREEAKDAERLQKERSAKRTKLTEAEAAIGMNVEDSAAEHDSTSAEAKNRDAMHVSDDEDKLSPPPKHETEVAADEELSKANRTVFLGNVSTSAIKSKTARKTLMAHLASFIGSIAPAKSGEKHKVESIRFRSTPYASAMPKKASFVKQELMDATTKSTNAYVVYSSPLLAREAAKHLNGTVVLDRHLRVDEVAHPAKVDHRRCVFVGNLGFVDDESNIQQANEADGWETRKRGKEPADVEEGLWRTFGRCGAVESVRVIRDSTTRVGKGIAYVQFADENSVEAALLLDEKKFPPMLPRKLRVARAKAQKRNAKPASGRPGSRPMGAAPAAGKGYQRKVTAEEASKMGRASKLLGRAAAAQMRKPERGDPNPPPEPRPLGEGIQRPEAFIFEGHRASAKQGKAGLKLAGKGNKKARVTQRSKSFKAKKKAA